MEVLNNLEFLLNSAQSQERDVFMNITIVGRKCNPREDFRARAEKKLSKIEKFFGDDATAKVTAAVEKSCQSVEVTVKKGGVIFRAEERAENMEDALDKCVDLLIRQIRKNKTKLEKKLRSEVIDDFFNKEQVEEETEYEIVREKTVELKPQSVDEAILRMNLSGHNFYMFLNSETEEINVVYKRNENGYGVLVPGTEK